MNRLTTETKDMELENQLLDTFPETGGCRLVRDQRKEPVLRLKKMGSIAVLQFPKLCECEDIRHFISTRAGGVSEGQFATLNYSIRLGDSRENVAENYRRTAQALGVLPERITGTVQTHTTNILHVKKEHAGMGVVKDPVYGDIDGLITNEKGLALAAYTADCVPILFADPVKKAIGIAHSGWRGTVNNMAGKMVKKMQETFGTDPADLIAAIGPSICQSCYEVDQPLKTAFEELFGDTLKERKQILEGGYYPMNGKNGLRELLEDGKEAGKYQLDLWLANLILLIRSGVNPEKIDITDICTAHNRQIIFSHRASAGKRGNLGAFIVLN